MQSFVGPVGQQQLVIVRTEKAGEFAAHAFLLRIHGNGGGSEIANRLARFRRAADGVFVEIEAQLSVAAFERRMIRAHARDGFTRGDRRLHSRTSTARACASKPSAFANCLTTGERRARPARVTSCTLMHFTKSAADNPPRARATPPVGKT